MKQSITLKLGDLLAAEEALVVLSKASLSAAAAFRLGLLLNQVVPTIKVAHDAKLTLFRKYGSECDGSVHVPPERLVELGAELTPLLDSEVTITVQRLPLALLGNEARMTGAQMMTLTPFIEDKQ